MYITVYTICIQDVQDEFGAVDDRIDPKVRSDTVPMVEKNVSAICDQCECH